LNACFRLGPDPRRALWPAASRPHKQVTSLGLNDFKKTGYGGPCPPIGRHRYFHKLDALDTTLDLKGATKSADRARNARPRTG